RRCVGVFAAVFQAEDGIRDRNVTGVQTCALPILKTGRSPVGLVHGHVDRGGAGFLIVEAVSQILGQGTYAAVAGGHDRLSGELRALFRWYVLVDGLLRRFLSGPAQAGTYGQAIPFDGLRAFFGRVAQHVRLGQLAHHVVAVERKLGLGAAARTRCVVDTKILALVLVRLRTVEVTGGDHAVEDQVTALHRDL